MTEGRSARCPLLAAFRGRRSTDGHHKSRGPAEPRFAGSGCTGASAGASLLESKLTPDGSAQPPGDRLELQVLFDPGEKAIRIEARAVLVPAEKDKPVVPVSARGDPHRDAAGRFLLAEDLAPPADNGLLANVTLIVPYQELDIPYGRHRLAYEIRGLRGADILFVGGTPITPLAVTRQPRTSMLVTEPPAAKPLKIEAIVGGPAGHAQTESLELKVIPRDAEPIRKLVEVNIPGGYLRGGLIATDPAAPPVFGATPTAAANGLGVALARVIPGSPADRARLEPGDTLTSINGRPLRTLADFADAIDQAAGTTMRFELRDVRTGNIVPGKVDLNDFVPAEAEAKVVARGQPQTGSRDEFLNLLRQRLTVPAAEVVPERNRLVFFATNRTVVAHQGTPGERFGSEAGPGLNYGSCLVNIPLEVHKPGNIETPSVFNIWNPRDPKQYFVIEATSALDLPAFLETVRTGKPGQPNDLIVFVHGFNNPFDDVVLRVAQLAHDTGFPGRAMLFSWPSAGLPTHYQHDERTAAQSGPALAEVLRTLALDRRRAGVAAGKIHLIAHSMGNRVLLAALAKLGGDASLGKPFGHIVLAAPDVDSNDFFNEYVQYDDKTNPLTRLGETVTLYCCSNDVALKTSQFLHSAKRLGEKPCFFPWMESILADNADTSVLGHGYIVEGTKVLTDLKLMMLLNLAAPRRPTLMELLTPQKRPFWAFR